MFIVLGMFGSTFIFIFSILFRNETAYFSAIDRAYSTNNSGPGLGEKARIEASIMGDSIAVNCTIPSFCPADATQVKQMTQVTQPVAGHRQAYGKTGDDHYADDKQ
jgi:hypothetical protein